ncbi:hypothetical protein RhiirC2_756028 [Rhizophagus irregularis]|uniref:Uncharacterized protein n=1 Tax=Rhizophagus irregularis TaxID=588596 RepID=A0A2N1MT56_9GLOM|nr:hypothetical protein RhiirC2_756028 [Rhizophagus irregularis]
MMFENSIPVTIFRRDKANFEWIVKLLNYYLYQKGTVFGPFIIQSSYSTSRKEDKNLCIVFSLNHLLTIIIEAFINLFGS